RDAVPSPVSARAAASEAASASAEVTTAASTSAPAETAAASEAAREDDRTAPAARATRPALPPHVRLAERGNDNGEESRYDDEEQDTRHGAEAVGAAGGRRRGLGVIGARDHLLDGVEAGGDPVGDLALAEARGDHLSKGLARQRIGELGLEAVADLETHLPVVHEDEEDDAVVEPLLPDAPRLSETDGIVLEILPLQRSEDRDDDLVATLALARSELVLQPVAVGGREHSRVVVDPVVGRGRDGQGRPDRVRERGRACEGDEDEQRREPAVTRAHDAGLVPSRCS